jgi:signal peptidase I
MNSKNIPDKITRFWKTDNETISFVRDIFVAVAVVLVLLTILWGYTGQWFGAPMVAIESGSMMHLDEPFGRVGTINAGDMVLLVHVDGYDDIVTQKESENQDGYVSYGNYGDVIIYRKYGRTDEDQIIHRAMCWVDYNTDSTYTVESYDLYNVSSITIPELGLYKYTPTHSGYITKGDNPVTNDRSDQAGGICSEPIKLSWVTGKARGELPWIGTVNLLFNDIITGSFWSNNEQPTVYNVPNDCVFCLVLLIIILISIPVSMDVYEWYRKKENSRITPVQDQDKKL